ncbi:MAG: acetate--CoA ligase family protein [Pseudomonadota bacterium]
MATQLPALDLAWLSPPRVVLVGASARDGSLGKAVCDNLLEGAGHFVLQTVNPKPLTIPQAEHFTSLADLPHGPGVAVIVIPPHAVADAITALGSKGITLAVVISAGLGRDTGEGAQMLEAASQAGVRIIGPNCLGLIAPHQALNASFARGMPIAGDLAFLSQSGAIATAMLEWAQPREVGFSTVVSVGDMAQTGMGELIDLLAKDDKTRAILLYLEGLSDAPAFMQAAQRASQIKPVIALKAGRTRAARQAALSHTGALAGSWDVYRAAFRESGIVTVDTLDAMFDAASLLHRYPDPPGKRLAIVTNGGGAGILAVDALAGTGAILAELSADTLARLDAALPPTWSHGNPVDIIGDADAARYEAAVRAVLSDTGVDAVMVMNCPTALLDPGEAARATARAVESARSEGISKPVFGCWIGDENFARSAPILQAARIPVLATPADASNGFGSLVHAREARQRTGGPTKTSVSEAVIAEAKNLLESVKQDGRKILSEIEAKRLLSLFAIPVTETRLIADPDEIDEACATIAGPYALKIVSPDITHKSDHGGVALGLSDARSVRRSAQAMRAHIAQAFPDARIEGFALQPMIARKAAHELFAGIATDPTFGPIVLFGAGGTAIEVIADKAIGLPPVTSRQARRMISETRIARLLGGYRHIPATDLAAVEAVLVELSEMAIALPEISELDVNPLLADADGVIALDARVILKDPAII